MPVNISSATLVYTLPNKALVRDFRVFVRADSAGTILLSEVGQVRIQPSTIPNMGGTSAVVDFGQPLTTSAVESPVAATNIKAIYRWLGDKFDVANPVFNTTASAVATANFAEVARARLQLELATAGITQAQAEARKVKLPALPADLEVRINGGPVVWS